MGWIFLPVKVGTIAVVNFEQYLFFLLERTSVSFITFTEVNTEGNTSKHN